MTSAERRQIGQAIREYDHERDESGREMLARLAREFAPEPPADPPYLAEYAALLTRPARVVTHSVGRPDSIPGLPQPKPRKRIVDKKAIKQYVLEHPLCEVLACLSEPCPEPHHLVSRKMGGDDVPSNLLRLCKTHHMRWHHTGGRTWLQTYGDRLTSDARSKVMAALRMDT